MPIFRFIIVTAAVIAALLAQPALAQATTGQTITFTASPPASVAHPATAQVFVTATASSGLAVRYFTNSAASICTLVADTPSAGTAATLNINGPGNCIFTATQAGNGTYAAAANISAGFAIVGSNVISFPSLNNTALGDVAPELRATAASGLPVYYGTVDGSICQIGSGGFGPIIMVSPGTCRVVAHQDGDTYNAAATTVERSFTISKGVNRITFAKPQDVAFSASNLPFGAFAASGLPISYSTTTPSQCTVDLDGTAVFLRTGNCTVVASQAGDNNWDPASPVSQNVSVKQGFQAIIFSQPAASVSNAAPPALSAISTAGLIVSFVSNTPSICTITANALNSFVGAGTCSITAKQAGNGNYKAAADITQTFTVSNALNLITFPPLPDAPLNGAKPTLAATANSNLSVTYAVTQPAPSPLVCTVTPGGTLNLLSAGVCSITASQPGNGSTIRAAVPVTQTFNVTAQINLITFTLPATSLALASGPFSPASLSSTSGTRPLLNTTSPACTIVTTGGGYLISPVAIGNCVITASLGSVGSFGAAKSVTLSLRITANSNSISFAKPADTTFTDVPPALGATAAAGPVSYSSNALDICRVTAAGQLTFVSGGTCSITASQTGGGQFGAAPTVTRTFFIAPGANTITFPALPALVPLASPPPILMASASSRQPVTYTSSTTAVCTVTSAGAVSFAATGTCAVTASQSGTPSYAAAMPVTRAFDIAASTNAISFVQPADTPFTSDAPILSARSTSNQPVSFSSVSPACSVSSAGIVRLISIGACEITASQAATAAVPAVARTFMITSGVNTITFPLPPNTVRPAAPPRLAATASSALPVTYTATSPAVCTVTPPGTITLLAAGSCVITAAQTGGGNYAAATPVVRAFLVTDDTTVTPPPAANVISFPQPPNTPFANSPPVLSAVASSGLPVSYASISPGVCSVTAAGGIVFRSAGSCSIAASQAGTGTIPAAVNVTRAFQISASSNVINFIQPANSPYGGPPPTLTATASSQLPVDFASKSAGVCTVTQAGALTLKAVGTCLIAATQSGNRSWRAAVPVPRSFSVTAAANIISFAQPPNTNFTSQPPALSASASSNLPVGFASATLPVCTVTTSGTIKFIASGTCSITAVQAGNAFFAQASPVTMSFAVAPGANVTARAQAAPQLAVSAARLTASSPAKAASQLTVTTTRLTASSPSVLLGETVRLTATVEPAPNAGTVTFKDGATELCRSVAITGQSAGCTIALRTSGAHSLTALFSGSSTTTPSVSSAILIEAVDQRPQTVEAIGQFISRRSDLIVSNAAGAGRQIDRLTQATRGPEARPGEASGYASNAVSFSGTRTTITSRLSDGHPTSGATPLIPGMAALAGADRDPVDAPGVGLPLNTVGNTDGPLSFGLSTSLRDMANFVSAAERKKFSALSGLGSGLTQPVAPAFNPFDIWIDMKFASFRDKAKGIQDLDGHFGILTLGADYVISSNFLAGISVQYDSMSQSSESKLAEVSGQGWMAGPYATVRLSDNLFLQGRAAWGRSSNEVSPFMTYTDAFSTQRWLVSSTLTGRWGAGPWTFQPSASLSYIEDVSESFADTFGAVIPEVTTQLGQAKAGPEVSYRYQLGNTFVVEPHAGAQLIWNFGGGTTSDLFGPVNGDNAGPDGVRGRAEVGLRATVNGGIGLDVSGSYDGIGSDGYSAITGDAKIRVPLN